MKHIIILLIGVVFSTSSCQIKKNNTMILEGKEAYKTSYAVNYLSVLPLRSEPNHRSEMVSQILFGEYMKVKDTNEEWSYIELEQDAYKGWVESFQIQTVPQKEYEKITTSTKVKALDHLTTIQVANNTLYLVKGSNLPFYSEGFFTYNGEKIPYPGAVTTGKHNRESVIKTANSYLNTPYLWGGKNPLGLDCSGFSQIVYHLNGHTVQRDASLQAKQGELVAFLSEAKPGDLAFFDNKEGNITHVGILLENEKIIHAAHGKVRIDKIDQEGIYNQDEKKYTHHLRMVRRYFQ